MAKNKLVKNITIDRLAEMVQTGFSDITGKMATKQQFEDVKKDLTIIKGQLADVVHQSDFNKLESRVEYLENILNLPAKKH